MGGGNGGINLNPFDSPLWRGSTVGQGANLYDQAVEGVTGRPQTGDFAIDTPVNILGNMEDNNQMLAKELSDRKAAEDLAGIQRQKDADLSASKAARQNEADMFTRRMSGDRGRSQLMQSMQGLQDQARKVRGRSLFGG